ncbi:hypothetical protein Agabi119p4_9860 [Agaricus bisporus var. burnettii]|uniref:Mob1/phocein n=1 Tax=Agaricus bisporus var. burnettii TaxID=192524 RepID=A0A8H7C4G2_AGABI|nr:hypothetical protein Agabi119p4_9860 [Agaricus bisporus var. burnettii]
MATEILIPPVVQRPQRGSRISTFYPVKELPPLSALDSAFQLQEYISLLIRLDVHDVELITSLPGVGKEAKEQDSKESGDDSEGHEEPKEGDKDEKESTVDEACWIYEQLRRLAQDLDHPLITTLQQECSRTTCPEMKAGEWLYLCVAHGNEGTMEQCCAIDYILHTLDSATALLNSPRAFPSRLQIPPSSHRHFSSLARRLGRIFAHAYYHHREAFEQAEAESSLYARFLSLTSKYDLVPSEFLVIPSPSDETEDGEGGHQRHGGDGSSTSPTNSSSLRGGMTRGTSYDPQHKQGHASMKHPLPSSFQDDFPDVPRSRRLPVQFFQPQRHQQQSPQQQQEASDEDPSGRQLHVATNTTGMNTGSPGVDSPRKMGRNRTHTMVLSDAAGVVDDLAKASAPAKPSEEKPNEQESETKAQESKEEEGEEKDQKSTEDKPETITLTEEEPGIVAEPLQQVELGEILTQDGREVTGATELTEIPLAEESSKEDEVETTAVATTPANVALEDVPADADIADENTGSVEVEKEDEDVVVASSEVAEEKDVGVSSEEGKEKDNAEDDDTNNEENSGKMGEEEVQATSERPDSPV